MTKLVEGSTRHAWRRVVASALYLGTATALGTGTWRILAGDGGAAGPAVGVAGILMLGAAVHARWVASEPERVLGAITDRVFDGLLLSAVAWAARGADPAVAAGALLALTAGFLAAYIRARSAALGYEVEESLATRGLRYALLAAGLFSGGMRWAVWAIAVVGLASALVRASQVAKEERV